MKFDPTKLSIELSRIQKEFGEALEKIRIEASAGGGMVKVIADGHGNVISIKIEPELIKENDTDIDMLQDLIVAAVNEAKKLAKTEAQKEMQKIVGLPIPGIFPDNLF
jgi:DNA-binding YbaB/EbfC family protein